MRCTAQHRRALKLFFAIVVYSSVVVLFCFLGSLLLGAQLVFSEVHEQALPS